MDITHQEFMIMVYYELLPIILNIIASNNNN